MTMRLRRKEAEVAADDKHDDPQDERLCPTCGSDGASPLLFCESCGARLMPAGGPDDAQSPLVVLEQFEAGAQVTREGRQVVVRHTIVPARNNGFCVAAMVLGVIAMVLAFVPFFDFLGLVLAVLAIIFGGIGIPGATRKAQAGRGMGIAGLVLGLVSVTFTLVILFAFFWGILGF